MRSFFIIVAVMLGLYGLSQFEAKENRAPLVITKPVYSDTRFSMESPSGSIDMVILMKNAGPEDCESSTRLLEQGIKSGDFANCTYCTGLKSQCLAELPPRFVTMFENRPSYITYLSLAPGNEAERDMRVVFWGLTVEQSDMICEWVGEFQEDRRGHVSCVRARRG